jgi:hypothetical protein
MKLIILQAEHAEAAIATRIVTLEYESKEAVDKLIEGYLASAPKPFTWREYRATTPEERAKRKEERENWAKAQPDLQIGKAKFPAEVLVRASTYVYDLNAFFEEFKEG